MLFSCNFCHKINPVKYSQNVVSIASKCLTTCVEVVRSPYSYGLCKLPFVHLNQHAISIQSSLPIVHAHVSQLLRVDPSALASSPPAIGWRPAYRGRPGATRDGCDLYTFILWAGSTRRDREGGSCSVLYSDLLRAVGTPVPGEMINGANHYGGSPLILLNKGFANGRQEARRRPGRRRVNETKRLATGEPATRLVSARGV